MVLTSVQVHDEISKVMLKDLQSYSKSDTGNSNIFVTLQEDVRVISGKGSSEKKCITWFILASKLDKDRFFIRDSRPDFNVSFIQRFHCRWHTDRLYTFTVLILL